MVKFNSTRNKINKLWEGDQSNENDTDRLPVINKDFESYTNLRKNRKIVLLEETLFFNDISTYSLTKRFSKFPEWATSIAKVILKTRLEDDYASDKLSLDTWFEKHFIKISDDVYDLNLDYGARARIEQLNGSFYDIPIYVTIDLYFLEKNKYYTVQTRGQ